MVLDLTGIESEELQAAAWRFVWTVTQGKGWNREVAVGLSAVKRLAVSITSSFLTDGDQAESCGQEQLLIQAFSNCTVSYNKKRERTGWCNFFLTWFFSAVNGFGMQISNFCSNHSRDSRTFQLELIRGGLLCVPAHQQGLWRLSCTLIHFAALSSAFFMLFCWQRCIVQRFLQPTQC